MSIWQLCANLFIPNCLRSNLSYSPLAALELYVKNYITQHFRMVKYKEHDIIVFQLKSENDPVLYNDTIYVRKGNNTEAVTGASAIKDFYMKIFSNK